MGEHVDKWIWEALLRQAEANLRQTEANLRQSEANLETARTLHLLTQHKLCQESVVEVELDRLEAWFVAEGDAETGAVIAKQIVQQAKGYWQDKQQTVETTGELGNAGGKRPSPAVTVAANADAAKPAVGTKRRIPSVLELLTANGGLTDRVASKADESSGAGDKGESEADKAKQESLSSKFSLGIEAGCSASGVDVDDEADRRGGDASSVAESPPKPGLKTLPTVSQRATRAAFKLAMLAKPAKP